MSSNNQSIKTIFAVKLLYIFKKILFANENTS